MGDIVLAMMIIWMLWVEMKIKVVMDINGVLGDQ